MTFSAANIGQANACRLSAILQPALTQAEAWSGKLLQLGLADIRPGGVRVVPIEEATLEVLGHLLIRGDTPDPRLVSEVLDVYGALMSMSARTAIQQADDSQIEHMREIVRNLLDHPDGPQHDWRTLGVYFTKVNQNLVLRNTRSYHYLLIQNQALPFLIL